MPSANCISNTLIEKFAEISLRRGDTILQTKKKKKICLRYPVPTNFFFCRIENTLYCDLIARLFTYKCFTFQCFSLCAGPQICMSAFYSAKCMLQGAITVPRILCCRLSLMCLNCISFSE